ncbi:glutaredoxin 3 [Catenovulum agarivorans DS-2]|uniref:Glutaredoxin n=1 Tax=Catenovulum agarivorans DS-2 TaxID=1328313 RepID=W7QCQ0_9ALTE|nr:glutaredoxin 3 [Catenovulum agarivorans]EWH10669.1 glutaredoxin 3 [Catenovulum agarivorans DS-2]
MATVTIYSKGWCPFCRRAKALFMQKGVEFNEIDIDQQPEKRDEMIQLSGRSAVPQIFINEHHVGGCDDLFDAEYNGELDKLLNA